MKILYAATGEIAIPVLERLHELGLVKAVLTAPDAPGKRGSALIPSPVKSAALKLGLPVSSPEHLGSTARIEVSLAGCDTLLSFCYGKIFGPKFLALFKEGYNIHPSLLPAYRGPSPVYETVLNGDRNLGITLQKLALECDSGDIMLSESYPLDGTETTLSLEERVSGLAVPLAEKFFTSPSSFTARAQEGEVSTCSFITKEDGRLDFTRPAASLHAQIRACWSWPKAFCTYKGETLYITGVHGSGFEIEAESCNEKPGTVVSFDKNRGFKVSTGEGYLYISRLQAPARKEMAARDFLNGNRDFVTAELQ